MNPPPPAGEPPDTATGLPFLPTWGAVYAFVLAALVLWVGLLTALTLASP